LLSCALLVGPVRAFVPAESLVSLQPAGSEPAAPAPNPYGDDELLLDQVFESHLPTTLQKNRLRFSAHPHLGDLQHKDNLRTTTSLRYGLTDNCEVSATGDLYFSHGFGAVRAFDDYGVADLQLSAKINLGQPLLSGWDTAIGGSYQFPTGRPVPELTDGLRHADPYVTFSHRLRSRPNLRIFVGLRADVVTHTSLPGTFGKNAFHESSTGLTGGWVVDHDNWHYTFEASFDTTRLITNTEEDVMMIRPGVIWEIPTRRNPQIMSHWTVGVAVAETYGPGGNSVGASCTLRYSSDPKDRFHRTPIKPGQ